MTSQQGLIGRSGPAVRYIIVHELFMELQQGRINKAETDEEGKFFLPVIVHDTDCIKIIVQAQGFETLEENLIGIDFFSSKNNMVGLIPLMKVTKDHHQCLEKKLAKRMLLPAFVISVLISNQLLAILMAAKWLG